MAKDNRGGRGGTSAKGELILPNGSKIEFDGELQFDGNDKSLTGTARTNIENWEAKRRQAKIEYAYAVTQDGNQIGTEQRGGKGSVRVPIYVHDTEGAIFTHNHPRGDGILGGTFSDADLNNFAKYKNVTTRATAKEGTYSISKGSNFDKSGFMSMVRKANADFDSDNRKAKNILQRKLNNNEITYSEANIQLAKAFNTSLVKLHNTYRNNQKNYGYTYTLEKHN